MDPREYARRSGSGVDGSPLARVKDNRDFARERRASEVYEELRKLSLDELLIEAKLAGVDTYRLNRQQIIAAVIDKQVNRRKCS